MALADESGGNPYLLVELARFAQRQADTVRSAGSVDEMLRWRIAQLPAAAARLLEMVAIAGERIGTQVVWEATGEPGSRQSAIAVLRTQCLIQVHRSENTHEIEAYHDRVRVTVERSMPEAAQIGLHLRLARKLEESGQTAAQRLAVHFRAGLDRSKAVHYSLAAAEDAHHALAFESAAQWYRSALELDANRADADRVRRRLAEALSSAGRGTEAAALFLQCAESAGAAERLDLERRAAADFLVSGHTLDGLRVMKSVLRDAGMKMPQSAAAAIPGLLWDRLRIFVRGFEFRERARCDDELLQRIDACWTAAQGLGLVDTVRAARFHARHLLWALDAGDPYRATLALSLEAGLVTVLRGNAQQLTGKIIRRAEKLAQRCGHPHALGMLHLAGGMSALLGGEWARAHQELRKAEDLFREKCSGVAWELATARLADSVAMFYLGEMAELAGRLPRLIENSRARGDLYESTALRIRIAMAVYLSEDRAETAAAEVRDAISQWPSDRFYLQHVWALIAETEIALYRGDPGWAWRLLREKWWPLTRSLLMSIQFVRLELLFHRGSAALAMACEGGCGRDRLIAAAAADARKMERTKAHWAIPLACLLRGGVAATRGENGAALQSLQAAVSGFERAGMQLYAAAARRRMGEMIGGAKGDARIESADDWMRKQQIRDPRKIARMLAPGRYRI